MVNLYQLLGIAENASMAEIQNAIQIAQHSGRLNPQVILKAQEWLLKPEVKIRYDAQLAAHIPTPPLHPSSVVSHDSDVAASVQQKQSNHQAADLKSAVELPSDEYLLEALLGTKNLDYYVTAFEALEQGKKTVWNWAAFFGGGYWLCARGMWTKGLITLIAPLVVFVVGLNILLLVAPSSKVLPIYLLVMLALWLLGRFVYLPSNANLWYEQFAMQRIAQMKFKYAKKPARLLKVLGETNNVLAAWVMFGVFGVFALIAVVGILAAIMIPAYVRYLNR